MSMKHLSLKDYVAAFYARKRVLLICLLMTPAIALLVSLVRPKIYQASVKIWAKEQRAKDPFEVETRRLSFLKDQQELMLSNEVASRVLEELISSKAEKTSAGSWQKMDETQKAEAIARLKKRIEIDIDVGTNEGGSSFIVLKVKASQSAEAARTANLYTKKYVDYYYELRSKTAQDSYRFLENRLQQVRSELADNEKTLQEFEIAQGRKLIPLIELIKQGSSASFSEAYKFMTTNDLLMADAAERFKEFDLLENKRKETHGLFVPRDSSSKNLSLIHLQDNLVNLQLKLNHVRQRRTEAFDDVGMLQREVGFAERLLRSQNNEDFESRSIATQALRQKQDVLSKRVEEIREDLSEIATSKVFYERLRREVENSAAIYKKVQEELEGARTAAELSVNKTATIYVIDQALPPLKPVSPNIFLNVLLGIVAGIVMGVGLIMAYAYMDRTIKTPEDVSHYLGLDVLGSVSLVTEQDRSPKK